jgi:protein-tyrosine kinase
MAARMSVPRARTQADAIALAGAPVVTELPPPTARPTAALAIAHAGNGEHAERVRALRTELLLRQRSDENRVLAIVGTSPCEGRSRLAGELAIAYAQTGAPTLLVDADLRRGCQARLFDAAPGEGFAEALASGGSARLQGVHGLPQLALVTAGEPSAQPLELLSGARLAELLRAWRQQFRHVVIDTPPARTCADGLAVASQCGAALVVSRTGRTRLADVQELLRGLSLTPARVLGCVLTEF